MAIFVILGFYGFLIYRRGFLILDVRRDVTVNQSQSVISSEDVHVRSHFNPIKESVFGRRMEISEVLAIYHKDHMETKFQFLVMCFATGDLKIKLMVLKDYVLLFDGYYR